MGLCARSFRCHWGDGGVLPLLSQSVAIGRGCNFSEVFPNAPQAFKKCSKISKYVLRCSKLSQVCSKCSNMSHSAPNNSESVPTCSAGTSKVIRNVLECSEMIRARFEHIQKYSKAFQRAPTQLPMCSDMLHTRFKRVPDWSRMFGIVPNVFRYVPPTSQKCSERDQNVPARSCACNRERGILAHQSGMLNPVCGILWLWNIGVCIQALESWLWNLVPPIWCI